MESTTDILPVKVPSVPERLATLEAGLDEVRREVGLIHDDVHGGGDIDWPQSLRGRMHHVEGLAASAEHLEHAARELRRARKQRFDTWAQVVFVIAAIVTAGAAVVGAWAAVF